MAATAAVSRTRRRLTTHREPISPCLSLSLSMCASSVSLPLRVPQFTPASHQPLLFLAPPPPPPLAPPAVTLVRTCIPPAFVYGCMHMCMNVYTSILSYIHDLEHMYMCMICKGATM